MPGGQGGPRFPGFGVGRGFAIWGPFPVHAPDTHRKRGPGQQGLRVAHLLGRNLDGNQIAWKYRTCAGHVAAGAGWPGRTEIPSFGVGRGFAIGPFPVHEPDSTGNVDLSQQEPCVAHCPSSCRWLWWLCFTHGHFGFQKQRAAPVCMILMIFLEARPRAGAIKATPATDLMVFPAVPDHSRPQVRLALSCRPRLGFGSRGLVVRSQRHLLPRQESFASLHILTRRASEGSEALPSLALGSYSFFGARVIPWGSRRQAMKFRRSAAGKSRCRTPLPSRGPELSPEWQAF